MLDLQGLTAQNREEYLEAIAAVIDSAGFIGGNAVEKFERNFSEWVGSEFHAVGCGNGTDAITLAVKALDLPAGAEAIIPAMTFFGTSEGLLNAGLTIKLVDVEAGTWLMDPASVENAITKNTKVLVPVHLYGQMAQMDRLREIADRFECRILEDAAQAHGSRWKNRPVGSWGDLASFSFYPGKNLGAFGDAGAVLSRDEALIKRCSAFGKHGGLEKYQHDAIGGNSRLDGIQAAVLNIKLKYVDRWNEIRRSLANIYFEKLANIDGLELPVESPSAHHTYHLFVVLVEEREKFCQYLKEKGVGTGIHYPQAIHQIPAFRGSAICKGHFPNAERVARSAVSLPICPTMSNDDAAYVASVVASYFNSKPDRRT